MLGLPLAMRLPLRFSAKQLQEDLTKLAGQPSVSHYGPYHDGSWAGLALISHSGRSEDLSFDEQLPEARETEIVGKCPYFKHVLDSFECDKTRARLLKLPPGGRVYWHRDPSESVDYGLARIHVPVVTNPGARLRIGLSAYNWLPGEVWYADYTFAHRVENTGESTRIHMVIDLRVNDWVLALFPQSYLRQRGTREFLRRIDHNVYWYFRGGRGQWNQSAT